MHTMFMAAKFTMVELWNQPRYLSTDEWIKKDEMCVCVCVCVCARARVCVCVCAPTCSHKHTQWSFIQP